MQKSSFFLFGFALAQAPFAFAQLAPLPPSSLLDGIFVQPIGSNQGAAHWENPACIGAYLNATHNPLGLSWQTTMHSDFAQALNNLEDHGGLLRAIFLGTAHSHGEDFGYSRSGAPHASDSYTLIENLSAPSPTNLAAFGNFADIEFTIPDSISSFDFWLNRADGAYTFLQPGLGSPLPAGNLRWSAAPIYASTWVQSLNGGLGGHTDVATHLVTIDAGPGSSSDAFVMALQVHPSSGGPLTPVPEPSTYGLFSAVAVLGLALRRRFRADRQI